MRYRWLCLVIAVACGGKQAAPPPPDRVELGNSTPAPADAAALDPSGCAPVAGITAEGCAAQGEGCRVGPHPYCSGIRRPPDEDEQRMHGPCTCVCPEEIEKCAEVP